MRHTSDMKDNNHFDHTGTDGSKFWERSQDAGYYGGGGENIAWGQSSVASVMNAWMNSPGHRGNILNANYMHFGTDWRAPYWTQVFGSNSSEDCRSYIASLAPSVSAVPSGVPSNAPSKTASDVPSTFPSVKPSLSQNPTLEPSDIPSKSPSEMPSDVPSKIPSKVPSDVPSKMPSDYPTRVPSFTPSDAPSRNPSEAPSDIPSEVPSAFPSDVPTISVIPTFIPSNLPSDVPSDMPSVVPTDKPSFVPTDRPSESQKPTNAPTYSVEPSDKPSGIPSEKPSVSLQPSLSLLPSDQPTHVPSDVPSDIPSDLPSTLPSHVPTFSAAPSDTPSDVPSIIPSDAPSVIPSDVPSNSPTISQVPTTSAAPTNYPVSILAQAILEDNIPDKASSHCQAMPMNVGYNFNSRSYQTESDWYSNARGNEEYLFLTEMQHVDENTSSRDWSIKIGTGGNIYSFVGPFGESVPPQTEYGAYWVEDVWQTISRSTLLYHEGESIYQSGTYQDDDPLSKKPFYSPNLGKHCSDTECSFMSWPQQVFTPNNYKSPLTNFQRYRNCGDGIIEMTALVYSDYQAPWDIVEEMYMPWYVHIVFVYAAASINVFAVSIFKTCLVFTKIHRHRSF